MIVIKGKSRSGAASLARHLMNETTNEKVTVAEVRGTLADSLLGCFQEIEDIASGTRCTKSLYHAQINPDPAQPLTPEQWQRSIELLEEKLGLSENHPRAVVFHEKEGRQHAHVVWGRIDPETMLAWHDGLNYQKHEWTARELEKEFGRERLTGVFTREGDEPRPERTPDTWEMQQGDRLEIDPRQLRAEVRELRSQADNGPSFAAALADAGYTLCQGERRDFVILDAAGGVHSLGRTLGVKAAELREYMADVDRSALPTVADAREQLERIAPERAPEPAIEIAPAAPEPVGQAVIDLTGTRLHPVERARRLAAMHDVQQFRGAWEKADSPQAFIAALEDRGYFIGQVNDEEAHRSREEAELLRQRHPGAYVHAHRAGDLVVINRHGRGFTLSNELLDDAGASKQLDKLADDNHLTLDQAKQVARYFSDQGKHGEPERDTAWMPDLAAPGRAAQTGSAFVMQGVEQALGAVESLVGGLEHFLFSGSHGGGQAPAAEPPAAPPAVEPRRQREAQIIRRQDALAASTEPNTQELIRQQPQNLDADLLAEMRRFREAREREERERDGGRERER